MWIALRYFIPSIYIYIIMFLYICVCVCVDDVIQHNEIYLIIFLWCLFSLIKVSCVWAETSRIKAIQGTKAVQLWLVAYTLCISEIRLTLQAEGIKQSTVTELEVVWLQGLSSLLFSSFGCCKRDKGWPLTAISRRDFRRLYALRGTELHEAQQLPSIAPSSIIR